MNRFIDASARQGLIEDGGFGPALDVTLAKDNVTVDAGKINARFKDGVLHVTLPKTEAGNPKQIEVTVS